MKTTLVATATASGGVFILNIGTPDGVEPTPAQIEAELAKSQQSGAWNVIDPATLPQDRTFRAAWKPEGDAIAVDMPKAIAIHKERLRKIRAPLLEQLDIETWVKFADDDKEALRDIQAQKQALRDVTDDPRIEAATTPDELKAVVPEVLSVEAVKAR